jgi:hydroxypyruvate reductase
MTFSPAPRDILLQMFEAAVEAARPENCIPGWLPSPPPGGKTIVVGAGKASAAMAAVVEKHWQGALSGIVVTRYGYEAPCDRISILSAAHPVPDELSEHAANQILGLVGGLSSEDLVIALMSGGGSSLMSRSLPGMSLDDKRRLNRQLLMSGASISEINCVRRHLSAIKGGRLAAACYPARLVTLLVSDVPGDSECDIASGPTVPDPTCCSDALNILLRYSIDVPGVVLEILESGQGETLKPGDQRLSRNSTHMVAAPQQSLEAAARVARNFGVTPMILGNAIEGESREVARAMAGIAKQVIDHGQPLPAPCVLISGGETTVTVRGSGSGGRNVEFLLALGIALGENSRAYALAADTDGVDGGEETAGAFLSPDSLLRARSKGLNPQASLDNNDGHGFFRTLGDSLVTGPTMTNVNDFRAILIP